MASPDVLFAGIVAALLGAFGMFAWAKHRRERKRLAPGVQARMNYLASLPDAEHLTRDDLRRIAELQEEEAQRQRQESAFNKLLHTSVPHIDHEPSEPEAPPPGSNLL